MQLAHHAPPRVEQRRALSGPSSDMGSALRSRSLGRPAEGPADLVSVVQEGASLLAASSSEQRQQAMLVVSGSAIAERSTQAVKSVSEIFAPLSGELSGVNDTLEDAPELINDDPYGTGWIVRMRLEDDGVLGDLLDAAGYRALLGE